MDTDHNENIDETSPEFEPLNSVLDNEDSNDESISGMSDLVSVGSPVQLVSTENHETHSNGFESDKNSMDKLLNSPLDKNGILNHKNDNLNIEPDDKTSDNLENPKSNDLKLKNNVQSSRERRHSSSREKSSTHRSKDRNSSRHRSTSHRSSSQEKNDHKKYSSRRSNDKTNSSSNSHDKHRGDSNDKDQKQRRSKKSHHSDRDRTPKRDRKDSRSDKKEKSSSLCKEPKSLNGNRSDDESNGGGSSKQKSSVHKYKSSTSDKPKSSSSNHKSSRKDNGSKDVVDKLKDRSSTSKSSVCSSYKNGQSDSKKRKLSLEEPNSSNIEEKKLKWNELRSAFMTNDEQDAANILLSMREIPFESSQNEIMTENIIFIENSSTVDNLKLIINTTENKLEVQKNNPKCNNNDNEKEKLYLKSNDLEVLKSIDSIASNYKDESINNPSLKKTCLQIIRDNSSSKDTNNIHSSSIEIAKIDLLSNKKVESTEGLKLKTNCTEIIEMDLDSNKQVEFVEDVKLQISPIQNTRLDKKPCKEQFEFVKDDKLETSLTQNVEKQFSIKQTDDVNLQLFNSIENVAINSKQNKQIELAEDLKLQSSSTENIEVYSKLSNVEDVKLQTRSIINSRIESEQNKQFGSKSTKLHHISSTESIKIDSEPIKMVELVEDKIFKLSFIENVKIESDKQFELVNSEKEVKPLNVKINNSSVNYKTSECVSNDILKVPKLKLKLSSKIIKQEKRKKHHKSNDSKYKKMKSSKSYVFDNVPVIGTVKTAVTCNQNDEKYKCDVVVEVKKSVSTPYNHILQNKKCESINTQLLTSNNSMYTFKGFSHEEAIPSKNYTLLKNFINSIQNKVTNYNVINDVEMNDDYACTHKIRHNVEDELKKKSNCSLMNSSEFQGLVTLSKNNHNSINNDRFKDTACSDETNLDVENESNNSVCTNENNCSLADCNGYKSFASLRKNEHIMINGIVSNKLSYLKKNELKTVDDDKCKSSVWTNQKSCNTIIEKDKYKGIDNNFHPITNGDSVFKGFSSTDIKEDQKILKKRKLVSAQLLKLKKIAKGFKGFSEKEAQISKGYTFLKQQLELAKQQFEHTKEQNNVNNRSKNMVSGNNGIQNGRKLSNVMAIICDHNRDEITTTSNQTNSYTNSNDNNIAPDETNNQPNNDNITTPNQIISQPNNENMTSPNQTNNHPNNDDNNYSPAIINNNHDISTSNNWVVQQEMKYKLLPVKVKLERMLGYNCNSKGLFV